MAQEKFEEENLLGKAHDEKDYSLLYNVPPQINDVLAIMKENYQKLEKYFDTSERIPYLNYTDSSIYDSSLSLNRKIWWNKFRVKLVLGLLLITAITLIAVPVMIILRKFEP